MLKRMLSCNSFSIELFIGKIGTGRPSLVGWERHPSVIGPHFNIHSSIPQTQHFINLIFQNTGGINGDNQVTQWKDGIMIGEPFRQFDSVVHD